MKKSVNLALFVIGIILLVMGLTAADSFASQVSEFFGGSPTDKAIWLLLGGVFCTVVGGWGLLRGSKS